jgi:hypothetical protein
MSMTTVLHSTGHLLKCALHLHYYSRSTHLYAWATRFCTR